MKSLSNPTVFCCRVEENLNKLTKSEKKAADYMTESQEKIIYLSISALAEAANTSEATIVRICKKLGYSGFQDLKISVARELVTHEELIHEELKADDNTSVIIEKTFNGIIQTLTMTKNAQRTIDMEKAIRTVSEANKIIIIGSGNSAAIANDAQHKFLRIGLDVHAYTDTHMQMIAVSSLNERDVILAISHSGSSRDIVEAVEMAKHKGVTTISITSSGISPVTKKTDINLFTYSQETKYRMYALSSRIAMLAIIDTIYTGVALEKGEEAINNFEALEKALIVKKY
ncbi:MAG: MurR/RpiR family transcriptional regulator [Thermotaleaceae bacterium]